MDRRDFSDYFINRYNGDSRLKVKLSKGAKAPRKAYTTDAGFDLFCLEETTIAPTITGQELREHIAEGFYSLWEPIYNDPILVNTGVSLSIPDGYYGQIFDKSGTGVRGLHVFAGVIDSSFTGVVQVVMVNLTQFPITFEAGQKIAQLVVLPIYTGEVEIVDELDTTDRGSSGFGSTGSF